MGGVLGETTREWFDLLLGPGGVLVGLLVIILTGVKKMWVFGWYADSLEKDRDYWKQMAVRSLGAAEKAANVAQVAQGAQAAQLVKTAEEMSDAEVRDLAHRRGVF